MALLALLRLAALSVVPLLPHVDVARDVAADTVVAGKAHFSPYQAGEFKQWPVDAWLRFTLNDVGISPQEDQLLVLPFVGRAELYLPDSSGRYVRKMSGSDVAYDQHDEQNVGQPAVVIPKTVPVTAPLYLHVIYYPDNPFSPTLRSRNQYVMTVSGNRLVQGLFLGAMLAVFLFNLYAFFGLREYPSIFFAVYTVCLGLNELVTTGIGPQYFWPSFASDARLAVLIVNSLGYASFVLFARAFLFTRKNGPVLDILLCANLVLQLSLAVVQYALPVGRTLVVPLLGVILFGAVLVIVTAIVRWRQGFYPARFFSVAYAPLLVGALANIYYDAFLPPGNWFFAANGVEFGAMLFAIIVTCSEIDRMRILDVERRRAQRVASTDALTGIGNRLAFYEILRSALVAVGQNAGLGILYIDLDGFKPINDRHGHRVGDQLLCVVSQRIQSVVRSNDFIARIGGDEFAVLLRDVTNRELLNRIARNVRASIIEQVVVDRARVSVGASVGVSLFPDDGRSADELLDSADRDMYKEKQTHKASSRVANVGFMAP